MAQSGDLDMLLRAMIELRPNIEKWITDRDPALASKIGPEFDRILDPESLRADIATHVATGLDIEDIAQIETWASNPRMAAINAVLSDPRAAQPKGAIDQPSAARLDKVTRIARATLFMQRSDSANRGVLSLMNAFWKATDPNFSPADGAPEHFEAVPGHEALVASMLAQSLAHIDDADIDQFLAFAESPAARSYFSAVSAGMALEFGGWRAEYLSFVEKNLKSGPAEPEVPQSYVEELVGREIRIEQATERSGDLRIISRALSAVRPQVESMIQELNPDAVSKMAPELDRILAPRALLEDVAIQMGARFATGGLEQVEAWSSKPQMIAINTALLDLIELPAPEPGSSVSPQTREKLLRIAHATRIAERLINTQRGLDLLAADVARLLDPGSSLSPIALAHAAADSEDLLVERLVAPALSRFTEAEIDEYLAFAESEAGYDYFRAVSVSTGLSLGNWRGELLASIEANAALESDEEAQSFEELMAGARHLISVGALPEAKAALVRAERLRGDDSHVQMLLGEVATHSRAGPRPSRGQLRTEPFPEFFVEAEHHLARAIELDPLNGRAYVLLARAKFLQSEDSEAAALLAEAKKIDPELAWLRVNLADLASAQGRHDEAIALYREVLQRPEREPNVHYWALVRSRVAFQDSDRLQEYSALGRQYMQDHPENVDYPLVFAEHLLYSGEDDGAALAVLEKTNPHRNTQLRQQLLAKALAGLAHASRERTGDLNPQARLWLQRAIELSGGSESNLIRDLAIEPRRLEPMLTVIKASNSSRDLATQALNPALFPSRKDMVQALAEAGADLNAPMSPLALAPLASAALARDLELFRLLLELGADPERARIEGKSLDDWMSNWMHEDVIVEMSELLRAR